MRVRQIVGVSDQGESRPYRCYDENGVLRWCKARGDESAISRIVSFFPRYGRIGLEQALTWAAQDIEYTFDRERNGGDKGAFANLIRPRENVVRYGAPQAVFTSDPAAELEALYRRAVVE